jgi:hypothetical protein
MLCIATETCRLVLLRWLSMFGTCGRFPWKAPTSCFILRVQLCCCLSCSYHLILHFISHFQGQMYVLWRLSDHWVITLQIADPSSRHRGCPIDTRQQISDTNLQTGSNIWSQDPQGCSIPRHTDWPTVSHKVTSPHLLNWTEVAERGPMDGKDVRILQL